MKSDDKGTAMNGIDHEIRFTDETVMRKQKEGEEVLGS